MNTSSSSSSDVTAIGAHGRRRLRKSRKRGASELRIKRSMSYGVLLHMRERAHRPHVDYVGHIWDGLDEFLGAPHWVFVFCQK